MSTGPDPAPPHVAASLPAASEPAPVAAPALTTGRGSLRAFRHRDFRRFWAGALVSNTGTWLANLTVPFVLFEMTHSALWVGLATAAQFLPGFLVGPLGGAVADRFHRRNVLLVTQAGMAASAALLWVAWVAGVREPVAVLALVAVSGSLGGINMPSWQAFVNDLVTRADLRSAVTLNSLQFNAARSLGPAIAGVLLATGGPAWTFGLNALSFLFVLVALAAVRPPRLDVDRSGRGGVVRQFRGALTYVRQQPGILVGFIVVVVVAVLGNPVFQFTVVFAADVFEVDAIGLGMLNVALGVGAVAAAPVLSGWAGRFSLSAVVRTGLVVYGLAVLAFGLAPGFWFGVAALVVVGACFLAVISSVNTSIQLIVADSLRGRVLALRIMVFMGTVPVGGLVQGWTSDLVGPRPTVVAAGALVVVAAAAMSMWTGRLRLVRLDDPHDPSVDAVHARA